MADPRRFDWLFRPQERDEDTPLSAEARFAEAFGRLSAEERSALALSDIGGLGHEEIATRMGTEREIVEDLIARARESMRAALVDRSRRLLGALGAFQHAWVAGGPATRAAGAVAVAALGIGAAFDGSTIAPDAPATPPAAADLRGGDNERAQRSTAVAAASEKAPARLAAGAIRLVVSAAAAPATSASTPRTTRTGSPAAAPRPDAQVGPVGGEPRPSAGQVDRAPRLELVGVPPVAGRQVRLDDVRRAVLQLPEVTELVGDEVVGGVATPDQDRPEERIPVVAPETGDAEEPGRVHDPGPLDPDRLGIQPELVQPRLGADEPRVRASASAG